MTRKRRPTMFRKVENSPTVETIKLSFARHVQSSLAKDEFSATMLDRFYALCLSVRDHLVDRWVNTQQTYYQEDAKRVYYLSMEYLMGRALHNAIINLGYMEIYKEAMDTLGLSLEELEDLEADAGLGNGGLGRLAACFLDSMATLGLPAHGYGLRYDYGIFRQDIRGGRQVEEADDWLRFPNPWEFPRPEYLLKVSFGGRVEEYRDAKGEPRSRWVDTSDVLAMAYDTPVPGYGNNTVNTMRLWRSIPREEFDLEDFNVGDYVGAVERRVMSENITRVLYPNDNFYLGKELRLKQQYFLVSATLQDAIRRHLVNHHGLEDLADKAVFQLNDTHPALAVAELMRLLMDRYEMPWDQAWEITNGSMAYTNHTLLPEALEKWPVDLLGRLLPRHLQIINDINHQFLQQVREKFPGDEDLIRRVSIYEEGAPKRVRMAHLAVVGSRSVNGVAELHTSLLRSRVLKDFNDIWPEKLNNKTNGITPRRWLLSCNPDLAGLITGRIGDGWVADLEQLRQLNDLADDAVFQEEFAGAKRRAKVRLAETLRWKYRFDLNPDAIFDIQIKRIHEYKRQLLNVLHAIHLYRRLQREPGALSTQRVFIFGGKAAPGYATAKLIIKLIHDVARKVNDDPAVAGKMKVFFVPNHGVSIGEYLFPAADVSEQISTAGFEASGTGNMKFALNGALTLGTLDGANIEIAREVGDDSIFIFGNTVQSVARLRADGYDPRRLYEADENIREVIDLLASDHFNPEEPGIYRPLVDALLGSDHYLLLADFESYRKAHLRIDEAYGDARRWWRMAIRNTANVGPFSSDRTIRDYVRDIWKVDSYKIDVE